MKPLRVGAILLALILAATVIVIWKPWKIFDPCKAPEEFCTLASEVEDQDGVQEVVVDYEVTQVDAKDGDSSRATWTVHLDENLSGDHAGELATQVSKQLRTFVSVRPLTQSSLRFVAGEPRDSDVPDMKLYPLDVTDSDQLKEQISQAFALLKLGAKSVGQGSAVANDLKSMRVLSKYATAHDAPLTLMLSDGSVTFASEKPFNTAALELTLEMAANPSVENISFGSGGLSVHTRTSSDSHETSHVHQLLMQHRPLKDPTAFTLSGPGYAQIIEGWIGGKLPDSLIARPARLPDGVSPWPANTAAQSCTQKDLAVTLGSPDAALGSRYMALYAKNVSTAACAVNGYPKIQFFNAQGEQQEGVTLTPMPEIQTQRVVIPAGLSVISAVKWKAMSTANDPDDSTALNVVAAPGFQGVKLVPQITGTDTSLDVLDGAELSQSPWLQGLDGWPDPNTVGDQPAKERP